MQQPQIIEEAGAVLGIAVRVVNMVRFIAVDPRVTEIDGTSWASVAAVRQAATALMRAGRVPRRRPRSLGPEALAAALVGG